MGLQFRTIQKLLREDFPGTAPLVVELDQRDKLAKQIKAKLKPFEAVDTADHGYHSSEDKSRQVCVFSIKDPNSPSYYHASDTFELRLDDEGHLIIGQCYWRSRDFEAASISDLDEIVTFIQHCLERHKRLSALKVKRDKVRHLLTQAILAQVRHLAKEERFDFMSDADPHKLNLFIKLSDQHAIEVHIPFKQFKELLPRLRATIVSLRQLYEQGITFRIVGHAKVPRYRSGGWIKHQSL